MSLSTPTVDELHEDLVARWRAAFERYSEVVEDVREAADTVYTDYPAYALEKYTVKAFKPGARVRAEPTDAGSYAFQRDEHKRPLRVRFAHPVNGTQWRGIYAYRDDEVELIEFLVDGPIPTLYNRLILDGPHVLAEQRLVVNGLGQRSPEPILADPHGHFAYVTRYRIEDGVTVGAEELHHASGQTHRPVQEWTYDGGTLQRIVQVWPDGERRTLFAKRTKASRR